MKRCYSCGAEMPDNARFCGVCGKPLDITEEMIRRAAAGENAATSELYMRTSSAVYTKIRAKVPDDDTAMDLLQETYLQAFNKLDQLREAAAFPGWVIQISRNLTANWYKKNSNERNVVPFSQMEQEGEEDFASGLESEEEYHADYVPEAAMDRAETGRLLGEILDTLPEEQRIILVMRFYDELSLNEIAEELDVNLNTVKTRLTAGKKKVEAKVRELEGQGTKLYSMAPLPFLLYLLRNMERFTPEAVSKQAWNSIQARLSQPGTSAAKSAASGAEKPAAGTSAAQTSGSTGGSAGAGGSGGTVAGTAAKAAAGTAGKSLATKIIAGVLAVALVGGGAAAVVAATQSNGNSAASSSVVEELDETNQGADEIEENEETTDVVQEETEIDQQISVYAADYAQVYSELETQYGAYTESTWDLAGSYIPYVTGVFYANLIDFTGDGVLELIMAYGIPSEGETYPSFGVEIWSWDADADAAVSIYSASELPMGGGDFSGAELVIAYQNGVYYLVAGEMGYAYTIQILAWNGSEFAVSTTLMGSEDGYEIDGVAVTYEEYSAAYDEWLSDAEIYAPYGMGNTSDPDSDNYGPTNGEMAAAAQQAIADTKAALGLTEGASSGQADATEARAILEDVLEQYSEVLSGLVSYYDFAGAEVTQREGEYAIASDYFVYLFSSWFDEKTGYFQLSDAEKESLAEDGYLQAAFYDINGEDRKSVV